MPDNRSTQYINSTDYKDLEDKLKLLDHVIEDLGNKLRASRKLRYAEVDIEAEREAGRLQPDELYVPQHIIDTNIRREQASYVQYITQSPRAVILEDSVDPTVDLALLEKDLTKKIRYDGWQLSQYANIDGFQSNGYGVMELVLDLNNPGELGTEYVQMGDFAFTSDTRDIQAVEITARRYYFTKTRLLAQVNVDDPEDPDSFDPVQVQRIIDKEPDSRLDIEDNDQKDKSLYTIQKNMFRIGGIVHVAWSCTETCDDWIRKPRPLFIGRRKITEQPAQNPVGQLLQQAKKAMGVPPKSENQYETQFPYFIFPYLISENDTISHLKGRVFLDQDSQEAVSSLISSTVTAYRRAAGLYFSKDAADPNDDLLQQKNIFFRSGCIVNSKVTQFQLTPPDPGILQAVNLLVGTNANETSQVNFAERNIQKDSRKTATAITASEKAQQNLSTVQVVLFSIALKQLYSAMVSVIRSRVLAGFITVNPAVRPLYDRKVIVKPSGDVDVIEKQQMVQMMMQVWPLVATTPAAPMFMADLLEKLFPDSAQKYIQTIQQAMSQQAQQQQQMQQQQMQEVAMLSQQIVELSKHPDMFSEKGKLHVLPQIENIGQQITMRFQPPKLLQNMTGVGSNGQPKPQPAGHR